MTMHRKKISIVSDGDGDYSNTSAVRGSGLVYKLLIEPATGDDAPSANWDLTATETDTGDILFLDITLSESADTIAYLQRQGTKSSDGSASATYVTPCFEGTITLTGANMGDTKSATVWMYWRENE